MSLCYSLHIGGDSLICPCVTVYTSVNRNSLALKVSDLLSRDFVTVNTSVKSHNELIVFKDAFISCICLTVNYQSCSIFEYNIGGLS